MYFTEAVTLHVCYGYLKRFYVEEGFYGNKKTNGLNDKNDKFRRCLNWCTLDTF